MTPVECEFESEVLAAVLESRWPARTDAALVTHVAGCAICGDIVTIAGAIAGSRDQVSSPAVIPDSGRVWWVAQRRARLEAAEIAARPINATQAIALVSVVALVCAYFGPWATRLPAALGRILSGSAHLDMSAPLAASIQLLAEHAGLALTVAAVLVLVPVLAYVAMGRE